MRQITILIARIFVFGLIMSLLAKPAFAISATLAKTCREMAIKNYPPKRPGSKTGNADAQRRFFRDCISKNGVMPNDTPETNTPPTK
jgi:hypothetical protein